MMFSRRGLGFGERQYVLFTMAWNASGPGDEGERESLRRFLHSFWSVCFFIVIFLLKVLRLWLFVASNVYGTGQCEYAHKYEKRNTASTRGSGPKVLRDSLGSQQN